MSEKQSDGPDPTHELITTILILRRHRADIAAQVKKINERVNELAIELSAYERAAIMVFGEAKFNELTAEGQSRAIAEEQNAPENGDLMPDLPKASHVKRVSKAWARALAALPDQTFFLSADVRAAADRLQLQFSDQAIRSQLRNYVAVSLVERIPDHRGTFRLTELGLQSIAESLKPDEGYPEFLEDELEELE